MSERSSSSVDRDRRSDTLSTVSTRYRGDRDLSAVSSTFDRNDRRSSSHRNDDGDDRAHRHSSSIASSRDSRSYSRDTTSRYHGGRGEESSSSRNHRRNDDDDRGGFKKPSSPKPKSSSSSSRKYSSSSSSNNGKKKSSPPSRLGTDDKRTKTSSSSSKSKEKSATIADLFAVDPEDLLLNNKRATSLAAGSNDDSSTSTLNEADELEATSVVRDILKMFDDLKTTIKRAKSPSNLEEGEVLDEQEIKIQEAKLREVENLSLDEMLMRIVAHVDEENDDEDEENMSPVSGDDATEPGEITTDQELQKERWKKMHAKRASTARDADDGASSPVTSPKTTKKARTSSKKTDAVVADDAADATKSPVRAESQDTTDTHAMDVDADDIDDVESSRRERFLSEAPSLTVVVRRRKEDTVDDDDDDRRSTRRRRDDRQLTSITPCRSPTYEEPRRGFGYSDSRRRDRASSSVQTDDRRGERSSMRATVERDADFWANVNNDDEDDDDERDDVDRRDDSRHASRRYGTYDKDDSIMRASIDFRAPSYAESQRTVRSEACIADNSASNNNIRDNRDTYDDASVVAASSSHRTKRHLKKEEDDGKYSTRSRRDSGGDGGGSHRHRGSSKHTSASSHRRSSSRSPGGSPTPKSERSGKVVKFENNGDDSRFSPSGRLRGVHGESHERRKKRAEAKRGKNLRSMSADTLGSIFIDRRKLRELAIRNAIGMRKRGLIPLYCPRIPGRIEKDHAKVKLKELTALCRDIAAGKRPNKSYNEMKHPFEDKSLVNPHNTIDVNVRFALPSEGATAPTSTTKALPAAGSLGSLTTVTSRVTRDLRLAFPVSTGIQHRNVEVWFPEFQEEKREQEQKGKERAEKKKIREEKEAADAVAAAITTSADAADESTGGALISAERLLAGQAERAQATALAKVALVSDTLPSALTRDYNSLVFQRLRFQKELQDNPENSDAQTAMNRTQQMMMDWAVNYHGGSSTYLTAMLGERTGTNPSLDVSPYGSDFISPAACGPQAWARPDQLIKAAPAAHGIGLKLLQKMGWSEGVGIGKRQRGMLEPLRFIVKLNRRGLSTAQDYLKHQQQSQNLLKQTLGKAMTKCMIMSTHPCSALNEYCTKRGYGTPVFQEADDSGCAGENPLYASFMYQVILNGVPYKPPRRSRNKKDAKRACAEHALEVLGVTYSGQTPKPTIAAAQTPLTTGLLPTPAK